MPPESWKWILHKALIALALEVFGGFPLWFAPGWANGWPFGLTIHTVWSGGMAFLFSAVLLTMAVCTGAAVGFFCSHRGIGLRHGKPVFAFWIVLIAALAIPIGLWNCRDFYEDTLEMWPKGYPSNPAR
jgi:hypothetical protein